jgi:hypothetical protein
MAGLVPAKNFQVCQLSSQAWDLFDGFHDLLCSAKTWGGSMKRYLIFAALAPLLGGFWLLLATTVASGYWSHPPSPAEMEKLIAIFVITFQYSYLFGVVPALMLAAVDEILSHVKRIGWVTRMLILGAIGFVAAELLYGSRGPDSGAVQFILYGLVGLIPAMVCSWLVRRIGERQPLPA